MTTTNEDFRQLRGREYFEGQIDAGAEYRRRLDADDGWHRAGDLTEREKAQLTTAEAAVTAAEGTWREAQAVRRRAQIEGSEHAPPGTPAFSVLGVLRLRSPGRGEVQAKMLTLDEAEIGLSEAREMADAARHKLSRARQRVEAARSARRLAWTRKHGVSKR